MLEYNSIGEHPFDGSKPKRMRTLTTDTTDYLPSHPFNSMISIDVEKIFLHNTIVDPTTAQSDDSNLISKRNPLFELPTLPSENLDKASSLNTNETEDTNTYSHTKGKTLKANNFDSQTDNSNISKENKGETQSESNGKVLERSAIKRCHSFSGKFGRASTKDLTISINPVKISNEKCLNFRYTMERSKILRKQIEKEQTASRVHNLTLSHNSEKPTEIYVPKKFQDVLTYKSKIDPEIGIKKSKINGWSWHGDPIQSKPYKSNSIKRTRTYYIGIRRKNTIIYVRDIILIRPPREGIERPYVAKVASFWADTIELDDVQQKDSSMMMTVYWYYRPENVESLITTYSSSDMEVFVSRHYDDNSVACIIDRAYVLSYHSYCRFCALKRFYLEVSESYQSLTQRRVVPALATKDYTFPPEDTDLSLVFFCKSGYNCNTGKIRASR
ncbi:hypothetical protein LOD99_4390 [Oopsacas minuta]|uniref:BAH domain-containing protein n=1 Tax=Oopsacas minuta TaxID=111878 RepID=A0AAV7JV63_9METZ|nr:hypothetical protein LOD99_4390 [Oopsacas minuta]